MEENMMKRINKTMERLQAHNMAAYYVETKAEVVPLLKTLMKEGETVTHGGSVTLGECGVTEMLNSGDYNYLDRSKAQTPEEIEEIYRKAYFADTYLTSANAVTESGLLYNVDGNSNRVSAILYGPKQVVFICGYNKIVKDLDEAVMRLKTIAAPRNHNSKDYRPRFDGQVYHLNLIAKRPDLNWTPNKILRKYPGAVGFEEGMDCGNMDMSCNPEAVNAMIAAANEKGYLVIYNHPTWSCQTYPDYAPLKGLWGMEVRNTECCLLGHDENNGRIYKDLVNLGNRLCPVGSDDMHAPRAVGGSWCMVGAEKLTYESVIEAMEKGDLYMSCGPEIRELSVEDGILRVRCSDAVSVSLRSHGRFTRHAMAPEGERLNEAEFDLQVFFEKAQGDPSLWLSVTVTDAAGHYASTRAYYLPELQ